MLLQHIVAAVSAVTQSVKYGWALQVHWWEWQRYLKKSASLGLCYVGFGVKGDLSESWGAGRAGFLCCAYDVVTDWRNFDAYSRSRFELIMRSMALDHDLQSLAMKLYDKEVRGQLLEDGLERGYIALRFTLKLMGCETERELMWGNVNRIGRLCQIVDDVLDYEQDVITGDLNCLNSDSRDVYLKQIIDEFSPAEILRLFGSNRSVLAIALQKARKRAEQFLTVENSEKGFRPLPEDLASGTLDGA